MSYDYTLGQTTPKWDAKAALIKLSRVMNAADIIASNATLTANGKITAGDDIEAIVPPAGFVILGGGVNVTTAGTAGGTVDIGLAGGQEFVAGLNIVTTGRTAMATSATWGTAGTATIFDGVETIDVEYQADETVGEFTVYVVGFIVD